MLTPVLVALVGMVLLVGSADRVVADGSALAARWGMSPLVVGLTVVSIGTSLPELAIGLSDVRRGGGELAVGNIVGTNLVNLLLVLGLAALLLPLALERRVLRVDLPAMLVATVLLLLLGLDGRLTRVDGLVLLAAAVVYLGVVLRGGGAAPAEEPSTPGSTRTTGTTVVTLLLAMAVLVVGAELLVGGAGEVARELGASEALVGLTVVAIGTSAPELATSVISVFRGGREVALGNVLGSSVINIALVLGLTVVAATGPIEVPSEIVEADLLLLLGVAVLCVPVFVTGRRISRFEGGLFVAAYAAYLAYLVATRT